MAGLNYYTGAQPIVTGKWTLLHENTVTAGEVSTIKCGGAVVASYTHVTSDTSAIVAAALYAQLTYPNAHPYLRKANYSINSATITIEGIDDFDPILTMENNGVATTKTTVRTPNGPSWGSGLLNWSTGALPGAVANEDVLIANSSNALLFGIDFSSATAAWRRFHVDSSFTGVLGHPRWAPSGFSHYFRVPATGAGVTNGVYIGEGGGPGSGRLRIQDNSDALTFVVYKSAGTVATGIGGYGTSGDPGDAWNACVDLIVNQASSVVTVEDGYVGLGLTGATGALATLRQNGGLLLIGDAVTVGTSMTQRGGQCRNRGIVEDLFMVGSSAAVPVQSLEMAGKINDDATIYKSRLVLMGTGTVTDVLNTYLSTVDVIGSAARTIATVNNLASTINDKNGALTISAQTNLVDLGVDVSSPP